LKSTSNANTYAGQGQTSIFVFHHATPRVRRPSETDNTPQSFPNAEVGHSGHIFAADAGRLVPAGAIFAWDGHVHSPGVPGADRNAVLNLGLKFHPKGYKPRYQERAIQISSTELDIRSDSASQRYDAYWMATQPIKLLNFEPHMHATGMRMCIEAIYQRSVETLSCAGYDHNWVRTYFYDDAVTPLLPKGTILHTISWFDGTPKNANIIDPRNTTVWGRRSVQNMLGVNNRVFVLTDEQYQEELAKRREHLNLTQGWNTVVGCPGCFDTPRPTPAAAAAR
jgi:hypothetical protein